MWQNMSKKRKKTQMENEKVNHQRSNTTFFSVIFRMLWKFVWNRMGRKIEKWMAKINLMLEKNISKNSLISIPDLNLHFHFEKYISVSSNIFQPARTVMRSFINYSNLHLWNISGNRRNKLLVCSNLWGRESLKCDFGFLHPFIIIDLNCTPKIREISFAFYVVQYPILLMGFNRINNSQHHISHHLLFVCLFTSILNPDNSTRLLNKISLIPASASCERHNFQLLFEIVRHFLRWIVNSICINVYL